MVGTKDGGCESGRRGRGIREESGGRGGGGDNVTEASGTKTCAGQCGGGEECQDGRGMNRQTDECEKKRKRTRRDSGTGNMMARLGRHRMVEVCEQSVYRNFLESRR